MITFVWAEDNNGTIGYKGELPWQLPSDMKFFKKITLTGSVVMGRKTYESIPNPPLKNRQNIILTHNRDYGAPKEVLLFHTKEEVIEYARNSSKEVHVIGGASIFEMFRDEVEKLYRTVIHHSFPSDTKMIELNWDEWSMISKVPGFVDEKNKYEHDFEVYIRK